MSEQNELLLPPEVIRDYTARFYNLDSAIEIEGKLFLLLQAQLANACDYYEPKIEEARQDAYNRGFEQGKFEGRISTARELLEALENGEATVGCSCGCWDSLRAKYLGG